MIIAFVLYHFIGIDGKTTETKDITVTKIAKKGELTIAFVRSDSLWEKYELVNKSKKTLDSLEENFRNQMQYRANKFKADYSNYVNTAASLSLSQQKATESELTKRQDDILKFKERRSEELMLQKDELNRVLQDSILNFINRYNKKANYTYILEYAKLSGILFADEAYDITDDVVDGLNKEHNSFMEKKED